MKHSATSSAVRLFTARQCILAAGIAALLSVGAQAANITWDATTGATGSQDGAGTWNSVANNWWDGAANVLFTTGDNVTFGSASGAAGTITVDAGGVTAGTLTLNNAGSGSYQFSGGSITAGAVTKSGNLGVRFDSANTFTSVTASAGPYSATDGAFRLNIAGALGTAPITFTNTANMTGLYFLSGFGTATTFSNDIAFTASTVTTRLVTTAGLNLPTGQVVTFSGLLTGGSATTIIQADNSAGSGVSRIKLTNAANTVRVNSWYINRGGIEFTSDAALGNTDNDLQLDVNAGSNPVGTGLIFGANSITLNAARAVTILTATVVDTGAFTGSAINGGVVFTGQLVKRGAAGGLTLNGAGSGAGGISIIEGPNSQATGAIVVGNNTALGTGTVTVGTGSFTALFNSGGNRTITNAVALPTTGTQTTRLLAANATTFELSGIVSGGSATEELLVDTNVSGGSTGVIKLSGPNTFTASQIRVNRGGLAITSDASLGNAANSVVMDIGTATQIGLRFDAALTSARSMKLGTGKQVFDTNGNNVTLSGVVSNFATAGELFKTGGGTLTLTNTNTYTGTTTVNAGTLEAGGVGALGSTTGVVVNAGGTLLLSGSDPLNRINDSAAITLAGGIFNTAGLSETVGTLTLSVSSIIDFGAGSNTLRFADSSGLTWAGTTLSIHNWTDGSDHLYFGDGSGAGLLQGQLDKIKFYSDAGSTILPFAPGFSGFTGGFGEVVPVPEPSTIFGAFGMLGLVGLRERRKSRALHRAQRAGATDSSN